VKSYELMEEFCDLREEWFRKWLTLPNGIPCPNTFSRVMEALDPVEFSLCIHAHLQQTGSLISAKQISIDGKALRGSRSLGVNHIHAVSAWVCESGLTLAQAFVTEKSNEITAIPELLKMLNLKGAVVTLDAMGTQREIAEQIVEGQGDYLLFVKDNQKNLHREISDHFEFASRQLGVDKLSSESWSHSLSEGKSHGRKERRQTIVCHQLDWMDHEIRSAWKGLGCIIMVVRRSEMGDGRIRSQTSYYMSSLTRKQLRATHDVAQLVEILSVV
jgi:predicted transposase YbfD/YdcC